MLRNLDPPNIPSNSGRNRVEMLSVHTGWREVAKTGSLSNWWSRMPSERSSTIKSMKLQTRVEAHGNWWIGSRRENFLRLRPLNTTIALVSLLRVYGTLYTILSTQRFIAKLTSKFLTNLHKNHLRIGVLFPDLSSYQRLANVLTHLCLDQIGWHGHCQEQCLSLQCH